MILDIKEWTQIKNTFTKYTSLKPTWKSVHAVNKNIFLLDYVNDLEKVWLFLNASLLISTSTLEGFGVPILDALSINLPCLASNLPTFKEIKAFTKTNNLTLVKQTQL